jgi:anti-sigma factor RsiW
MNCEWREKADLYVDNELEPAAQQEVAGHLLTCAECAAVVMEQHEFKKTVRVAGRRFSAPPELYAAVRKQVHPQESVSPWWKRGLAVACTILLAALAFSLYSRPKENNSLLAQLIDEHVSMLASEHPVDVVSSDKHTVKPWYQGKLAFTFDPPELAKDSPFTLVGGKLAYAQESPGAELVYQVRQHKISVFVFQARNAEGESSATSRTLSFTMKGWTQGGLQYYLVTDASKDDADRLAALFQDANRS